jgi:hypothetical protein
MDEQSAITVLTELKHSLSIFICNSKPDQSDKIVSRTTEQVEALGLAVDTIQNVMQGRCNTAHKNTVGQCMGYMKGGSSEPLDMCKNCYSSAYYKGERQ